MDSLTTPLSGLMCERSMDVASLAEWASSLPDSPASLTAPPANGEGPRTPATSGPTRRVSLARYDPASSSWRTYQGLLIPPETGRPTLSPSLGILPTWGTTQGGELWELEMSEPRTDETGGGAWPTPQAMDAAEIPDGNLAERMKRGGNFNLGQYVNRVAWPTPQVKEGSQKRANIKRWNGLNSVAMMAEAGLWATPTHRDSRTFRGAEPPPGHQGGDTLVVQVRDGPFGHQAPRTPMPGQESLPVILGSPPPSQKRKLNPLFAEALMGLPPGWVDAERPLDASSYRRWETAWSRRLRRERS